MKAFERLKKALTEAPLLTHPKFDRHFYIQCDASSTGVGSVLFQRDENGNENPLAFMSKKLDARQRNYSVTELECYAAVLSVKKFRAYVEGHPFTIITDHSSLKWLMGQKDLSGRLARWSLKLQAYDFKIEYRKGSQNVVPDALSRMYMESLTISDATPEIDLNSSAFQEEEYLSIKEKFEANPEKFPDIQILDGRVYVKTEFSTVDTTLEAQTWKIWVPKSLTNELISNAHEPTTCAHGGIGKTLKRLKEKYFWPGMAKNVKEMIAKCEVCKTTKPTNQILRPKIGSQIISERPFQRLYIDYLGPYPRSRTGNSMMFVAVDHFSKFTFIKPMRDAKSGRMVKYLEEEIFHIFGVPEYIHSDNGQQFRSQQFKKLMEAYGIQHVRTAIYSPQSNSSERVNRNILAAIRAYISPDQSDWDKKISQIACSLRSSFHEAIKVNPYYATFGTNMITHGSSYSILRKINCLKQDDIKLIPHEDKMQLIRERVQQNLKLAFEKGRKVYDTRARSVTFKVGQEVFYRNFTQSNFAKNYNYKFADKFLKGRIAQRVGNNMYKMENLAGKSIGTFHGKDIKR